jgi:hypothetical protein
MRVLDTRSRELAAGCRIAPIVGCILTLINLLDVFLEDDTTTVTFVKSGLDLCVPFAVPNRRRYVAAVPAGPARQRLG